MKKSIIIIALVFLVTFIGTTIYIKSRKISSQSTITATQQALPKLTTSDLALYNGVDPAKPIYIGLNGKVYDVTAGKSFYEVGGTYHYLAGKDSSAQLNIIGGDIIVKKYPVVAILVN